MFGDLERSRLIAYSAAFIGLIALGSWISIPCIPVPFTLQTLFVLLAGAVMKRRAVIPVAAYVVLGALGLPVFHNGMAGPGVLLGPTGGYLIGFIFTALVVGLAYERESRYVHIAGIACGTAITLLFGMAWLMYSLGMGLLPAFSAGVLPFVIGGTIKCVAAYVIARRLP
ncbi:MAG: biotin transporter BioY [Methanoregula sp.]|jgi:biotin transport system substrate-specific component|uniref:biotin transporter BioY n=1 Tax=Methanoregula sp. TaxID=2052170 RepID=UPI0025D728C5|nr:biotin transporter BioY [Methanoregula sp.]MCK9630311.1 biotin transporter BioY [Methanoregula sp.]